MRRPGDEALEPGVVYVKTYRDVLYSYLGHPESKSTGPDGEVCRRWTTGRLGRRPVEAALVVHIGKEANRLEERIAGLITSEEDFLLMLGDDRSWELLVVHALRALGFNRVAKVSGISASTLADLIRLRTRPQKRHEQRLRRVAHSFTGDWLRDHDAVVPADPSARLAFYLTEYNSWSDRTAMAYEGALMKLTELRSRRVGVLSAVEQLAGINRRRVWKMQDPVKQEAIVAAVGLLMREDID